MHFHRIKLSDTPIKKIENIKCQELGIKRPVISGDEMEGEGGSPLRPSSTP